jgi:hypothetical protein
LGERRFSTFFRRLLRQSAEQAGKGALELTDFIEGRIRVTGEPEQSLGQVLRAFLKSREK